MKSPYLRTDEVADLLRFTDEHGRPDQKRARDYIARQRITIYKRGRSVLVRRDDLEATLVRRAS